MLVRGKESDLLKSDVVEEMQKRGPGIATLLEVEGVGHAPMLNVPNQLDPIKHFLLSD